MSAIILINGYHLKVENGDILEVAHRYCAKCECSHTRITVTRNGKEIAVLGDDLTVEGKDEIFGGVVVDENGVALPDPHWVYHILRNDISCMTEDKKHYVGICGKILDHKSETKHDRIIFLEDLGKIGLYKKQERLCPECMKIYERQSRKSG